MSDDPFIAQLEELDHACRELRDKLDVLQGALIEIRRMRGRDRQVSDIVARGPGIPARRDVRSAWSRLNEALHSYRVQVVRSMVDDEGITIADAARVVGVARQVASRLYHSAAYRP